MSPVGRGLAPAVCPSPSRSPARNCIDILTQVGAIRAALGRFESEMLKGHLAHCIEDAIVAGYRDAQRRKAAEVVALLERAER